MRPAQLTLRELVAVFRRRRKYWLIPAIIVSILSIFGAIILPSRYESSTTILVQRDEILNPLISFEMAVTIASEDRLRTFNEVIYSQTTIQRLIDTLHLGVKNATEEQRQSLVDVVKRQIATERRGSDSFRLLYTDTEPVRAQKAAEMLSNLFIATILQVEGQRNENTVRFFEGKLEEIRQKFDASQKQVVSRLRQQIDVMPAESRAAYGQMDALERQLNEVDARIKSYQQELIVLRTSPEAFRTDSGKQALYDLQRAEIPYVGDLRALMTKYDDYIRRYTVKYPEVSKLEKQIADLLIRMQSSLQSELAKQSPQRWDLERRRTMLVEEIKQSSISQHVNEDKSSDYEIYRKLYDEMKVKLEQAQTTRDLGSRAANQFIILDPALVPVHPSKPNRPLIVLGGVFFGLFIGFVGAIIKEMVDTTVRVPHDIEIYRKPVIAFIIEGDEGQSF
ncbi:MAG TPA: GNVR domain-containing protein [Bacteroidota bacterium]|nr:GNVR domain-containing protein [Bacteroidota bacterium]